MNDNSNPGAGTQTATEPPAIDAQQFAELQTRLTAVEVENSALRAREERAGLEATLASLRFSEGRSIIAPTSRAALADALMEIAGAEPRTALIEAIKGVQFAELGERGFRPAESAETVTLTEAEEEQIRKMAEQVPGAKVEDVRRTYIEKKTENLKALGRR